jgi:hypothetical protein
MAIAETTAADDLQRANARARKAHANTARFLAARYAAARCALDGRGEPGSRDGTVNDAYGHAAGDRREPRRGEFALLL